MKWSTPNWLSLELSSQPTTQDCEGCRWPGAWSLLNDKQHQMFKPNIKSKVPHIVWCVLKKKISWMMMQHIYSKFRYSSSIWLVYTDIYEPYRDTRWSRSLPAIAVWCCMHSTTLLSEILLSLTSLQASICQFGESELPRDLVWVPRFVEIQKLHTYDLGIFTVYIYIIYVFSGFPSRAYHTKIYRYLNLQSPQPGAAKIRWTTTGAGEFSRLIARSSRLSTVKFFGTII